VEAGTIDSQYLSVDCFDRETEYLHLCLSLSHLPDAHIVLMEHLIQAENADVVHHFVLYGYENSYDCDGHSRSGTVAVTGKWLAGWAPGVGDTVLPPNAGLRIGTGGIKSFRLNIHYNNPRQRQFTDSSGFRFYYTTTMREHDVGVMELADPITALSFNGAKFSPGLSRYDFECSSRATSTLLSGPISVYNMQLHMHKSGIKLQVDHYDKDDELLRTLKIDYYDFNFQDYIPEASITDTGASRFSILPGDSLRTTCWYNNDGRSGPVDTHKFGQGSQDEMCIVYVLYWPKLPRAQCGLRGRGGVLGGAVPRAGQIESDFTQRTAGVLPSAPNTCADSSTTWAHPTVGTCSQFNRNSCEVHGWDAVGPAGTSARDVCCVCHAVLPTSCADQHFGTLYLDSPSTCAAMLSQLAVIGEGCTSAIADITLAARRKVLLPDGVGTIAGVCPQTCGLCPIEGGVDAGASGQPTESAGTSQATASPPAVGEDSAVESSPPPMTTAPAPPGLQQTSNQLTAGGSSEDSPMMMIAAGAGGAALLALGFVVAKRRHQMRGSSKRHTVLPRRSSFTTGPFRRPSFINPASLPKRSSRSTDMDVPRALSVELSDSPVGSPAKMRPTRRISFAEESPGASPMTRRPSCVDPPEPIPRRPSTRLSFAEIPKVTLRRPSFISNSPAPSVVLESSQNSKALARAKAARQAKYGQAASASQPTRRISITLTPFQAAARRISRTDGPA